MMRVLLLVFVAFGFLGISALLATGHGGLAIRASNYLFFILTIVFVILITRNEN